MHPSQQRLDAPAPASAGAPEDELGYQLVRVAKLIRTIRAEAPRAHPAVACTAYPLLFNLCGEPARISTLAERTHTEMSTVSRAVAGLDRAGIVQRIPDPDDGRAQLITLTDDGRAALDAVRAQRSRWFEELLSEWRAEDVAHLITLLTRLGDTVETYRTRAT